MTEPSTATTTETPSAQPAARTYDVPPDADAYHCPYCEDVEPREDLRDLHVGHRHPDEASETELETFERTFERESNDVFIYHLKVISLVVAIYFIFLFTYSAVS
jgi:hypothetical protein